MSDKERKLLSGAMTFSPAGPADGEYEAVFIGVDTMTSRFGEGLQWLFQISSTGKMVSRLTTTSPTRRNACGKMLQGICCVEYNVGLSVNPSDFVGRTYKITVSTPDGSEYSRVESIDAIVAIDATPMHFGDRETGGNIKKSTKQRLVDEAPF